MSRVGTGVSSKHRIYTATITGVVGNTGVQLASITGNAKNDNGNTTLPILLSTDMGQPSGASSCVQGINIRNTGSKTLFIMSSSTDTVSSGYPLYPTEAARVDIRDGMNTYLGCAYGTPTPDSTTVAIWEV